MSPCSLARTLCMKYKRFRLVFVEGARSFLSGCESAFLFRKGLICRSDVLQSGIKL